MAATQFYVGASTPFGVIVQVTARVYNAEATVRSKDGSTRTYLLPWADSAWGQAVKITKVTCKQAP